MNGVNIAQEKAAIQTAMLGFPLVRYWTIQRRKTRVGQNPYYIFSVGRRDPLNQHGYIPLSMDEYGAVSNLVNSLGLSCGVAVKNYKHYA